MIDMKKIILMIASLIVILVLFFAFTGAVGDKAVSRTARAEETNTLTIGVYEPLTGSEAEGGKKELLGIRYANSVRPSVDIAGITYNIELLELDNESDAETAELDGKYFIKQGVTAVLGSYGTELSEIGAKALAPSGIPHILISSTKPDLINCGPSVFRVCYDDSFQAGVMANYAVSKGYKTAVVLTMENDAYSASLAGCFTSEFMRLDGSVFAYAYEKGQNNFQSIAEMISSVKADVVFLPSNVSSTANVIKQLRRNGVDCPILGGDTFDSASLMESCSNYGRDVVFCSGFSDSDLSNLVSAEFIPKFTAWLNNDKERLSINGGSSVISPVSALGYDAYMVLLDALSRSEGTDPASVCLALSASDYSGVTGKISFDLNGGLIEKHTYIKSFDVERKSFNILQTSSVGK